jgi:hypothetical protein
VFVDTETTSLRHDRRIWEIGMIRRDETGDTEIGIYVADVDLSEADPYSLEIGGFHERHPLCRPKAAGDTNLILGEQDAAAIVRDWTHKAHLVGTVPNFDAEGLAGLMRRVWMCPTWHYHLIDAETMAIGWLHAWQSLEPLEDEDGNPAARPLGLPWDSDAVSKSCGVDSTLFPRHTALGDARWARALYDRVTGHPTPETTKPADVDHIFGHPF